MQDLLNPAQHQAVTTLNGSILVVAGAGTGKTRVLEYRTLELVKNGVDPKSILLLTFTRRAASEMLLRAARHDIRCKDVSGGTFHSFSLEVLKRYGKIMGINDFTVLDRGDSEEIVVKLVSDLHLRDKKYFPKKGTVTDIISKSVNKDIPIELLLENEYPHLFEWAKALELVAQKYASYKKGHKFLDFDDLLSYLYELVRDYEGVRFKIQNKYQFIMVDEYQDTNKLQGKIVFELARGHGNILIVGDEMQSIYAFRGAEFTNMINFPKVFSKTEKILLKENYRSTQEILDVANNVLDQVEGEGFRKHLESDRHGEKPQYRQFKSAQEEAGWIAQKILDLVNDDGLSLRDVAVLFRAGFQSAPLEIELASRGIPFKKFGGIRFVETAHIKDVLAHLKVVVNPQDEMAWRRILLLIGGIGEKTVDKLVSGMRYLVFGDDANKKESSKYHIPNTKYSSGELRKLYELLKTIKDTSLRPAQRIADIIEYYRPILRRIHDDYPQREQDLEALVEIVANYTEDGQMLNDLALDPPDHSALNARMDEHEWVTLSTVHSAKGLEWNAVFVIQLQDGKFPMVRDNTKQADIEEERRLFYVAVTRAKEKLYLTSTQGRMKSYYDSWFFTRPSRFVEPMLDGKLLQLTLISSPFDRNKFSPSSARFNLGKSYDELVEEDVDKF